ncbi:unnamed protein product [Ranitomeya imitator]|uniref:Uncharacterized protein n=1 Tax=Ranitomeya imitator TaxID=111125 RepID=A0ABN9LQF6_9NEOB|nr:unnamed protein product [Ranitomeya imitator]
MRGYIAAWLPTH